MKPKEKAKELVEQFSSVLMYDEVYEDSIKCALIAIDEVIEALHEHHWQNRLIIYFWKEVKHELEKL
jgi:ATP:corrinoid adenosyltransferase